MYLIALRLLALLPVSLALPRPETVGAGGTCSEPDITVTSVEKIKAGPFLVSGARVDANPNGGGASFTKLYSVGITVEGGAGLSLDNDFSKILKKGLGIDASFSISKTTTTGVSGTVICPQNTLPNDTITWGMIHWDYKYHSHGFKQYYGHDPLARCSGDEIAHAGENVEWDLVSPAVQQGAGDGADAEVEFQCCTDSRSGGWNGSPVCPNAS